MNSPENTRVADEIHQWFCRIQRIVHETLFSIAPEGPHRDAAVLDVLLRNARVIVNADLDRHRELYTPLCMFLTAACQKLQIGLGRGHWLAAVNNVVNLTKQIATTGAESSQVGINIGSPATIFKQQLDQTIIVAGLGGSPSFLNPNNREIALGLAVNWGMRLLLAYALQCEGKVDPDRKDLTWVTSVMKPLVAGFQTTG